MVEVPTVALAVRPEDRVRRPMHSVAAVLLATAMLSWVAIANRSPLPFPDSRSYWMGGYTAMQMGVSIADRFLRIGSGRTEAAGAPNDGPGQSGTAIKAATGVRSVFYSLFVYVIGITVSLWGVVLAQSLALAWVVFLLSRSISQSVQLRNYAVVILGTCILTSAPWLTAELMPDVFTGVLVAAMVVLLIGGEDYSAGTRAALGAVLAFAIAAHVSHFPLALSLLAAGLVIAAVTRGMTWRALVVPGTRLGIPILIAVLGSLAVSFLGFHRVSLTPQSPPFLLARSLQDGPARLLLRDTCPGSGYEMCRHLDAIPRNDEDFVWNFIWAPTSLYMGASPEIREQIRREEMPLVLTALRHYPLQQMSASSSNLVAQLGEFGPHEFQWGGDARVESGAFVWHPGRLDRPAREWLAGLQDAAVIAAIFVLAYVLLARPRVRTRWREATLLVVFALIVNAFVCGVLSEPSPRYQARIVWLVVAIGLMFITDRLRARSFGAAQPTRVGTSENSSSSAQESLIRH